MSSLFHRYLRVAEYVVHLLEASVADWRNVGHLGHIRASRAHNNYSYCCKSISRDRWPKAAGMHVPLHMDRHVLYVPYS